MLPIYGLLAFLFEPLHEGLRRRPVWVRAGAYAAGFSAVEYAAGMTLRRAVGLVPWDYSGHGRWVLPGGATRLDYAPVFAVAGLILEHVHDVVHDLPVRRVAR